jgi:2-polyprenyl-6-hydroxyphenyl methylase / 3-demethylubiquinone-9 3-methyltransferase
MHIINNEFYNLLKEDWWEANDHMIVFLREESRIKLNYIQKNINDLNNISVLDIGAGAGFISIPLAHLGAKVTALDLSSESLNILFERAKKQNIDNIKIIEANALEELNLKEKYDLVLALDVLEHVVEPQKIIINARKNLKQNGVFIYHTLNQTFWCWLLYLQIVPRLIKHDPGSVHNYKLNIKPDQLNTWLIENNFNPQEQIGIRAPFLQKANWELLVYSQLTSSLNFEYTNNLDLGYLGRAIVQS